MPKISVIIPVYNSEKYLPKCLDSLINQTFKDIEIICVDDCSTDNSLEIIKNYALKDNRIKVLHNEKNINVGPSRNRGLEIASGKYIHLVDSDDWLELETYETLMQEDGADVLYFYIRQISNIDGKPKKWSHLDKNHPHCVCNLKSNPEILDNWVRYSVNKLCLKSFLDENNIKYNDYPCFEDHEFSLKVLLYANSIRFIDKVFYNYRVDNSSSITGKFHKYKEFAYKSYKTAECLFQPYSKDLKNKLIVHEFGKYFQILNSIYLMNAMSYMEFREELKRIDTNGYDEDVLNSKMFVQYREILSEPECSFRFKMFLRNFTRKYIPFLHDFLVFIRKKVKILGRI